VREGTLGHYGDYQTEIYVGGLSGRLPKLPVDFRELEARAHAAMSPSLVSYVAGGCGNEHTQNINVSAFERWGLIPRMLVGAAKRDLSIDLFGMRLPTPLFMSPSASSDYARRISAATSRRQRLRKRSASR
jgi:lactate 2-monooxygenase